MVSSETWDAFACFGCSNAKANFFERASRHFSFVFPSASQCVFTSSFKTAWTGSFFFMSSGRIVCVLGMWRLQYTASCTRYDARSVQEEHGTGSTGGNRLTFSSARSWEPSLIQKARFLMPMSNASTLLIPSSLWQWFISRERIRWRMMTRQLNSCIGKLWY